MSDYTVQPSGRGTQLLTQPVSARALSLAVAGSAADARVPDPRSEVVRVGVVIPCFNHGAFVAEAVRASLAQVGADVRVVIVDDGSTDGTTPGACDACASIDPARVRVIHQTNSGPPRTRNAGVAALRGHVEVIDGTTGYLVFLDADDWIEPEFVRSLAMAVFDAKDAGVSHGYCQERLVGDASGVWRVPDWDPILLLVTNLHPITALVRADRFIEAGMFDDAFTKGYEDWELWLRFSSKGWRGVRVREPLFNWRRHSSSSMVVQAVRHHSELFATLVDRYPELYTRHARRLIELSNELLRRSDANWLDETLDAIYVRDLRARNCELFDLHEAAQRELATAKARIQQLENKPVVRLSRRVHSMIDGLPRPLARVARGVASGVAWLVRTVS